NLAAAIKAGTQVGPWIDATAPYVNGPSPFTQMYALKDSADARRFVAFWADAGATSFKAYMNITRAELAAAVDEAHRRGRKLTGPVPNRPSRRGHIDADRVRDRHARAAGGPRARRARSRPQDAVRAAKRARAAEHDFAVRQAAGARSGDGARILPRRWVAAGGNGSDGRRRRDPRLL